MNKTTPTPALVAANIVKNFDDGNGRTVHVLSGVNLTVSAGEIVAVIGASGSGKSTLLQILGGLDAADRGSVTIAGTELSTLSADALGSLRNRELGFVYQFHHLLPEFTALENVAMPLIIGRTDKATAHNKARTALNAVGLSERTEHLPSQLSGGERQRTAIARAMVTKPACILADEPTGNLDHDTALDVFERLMSLSRIEGCAILIVTHDRGLAARCDRVLRLEGGVLVEEDVARTL